MTWYQRKMAVNTETGEQHNVVATLYDESDLLYPTMFFNYFSDAPIYNTATQYLETLDLSELIEDSTELEKLEKIKQKGRMETPIC